jgi:hypothetical protein
MQVEDKIDHCAPTRQEHIGTPCWIHLEMASNLLEEEVPTDLKVLLTLSSTWTSLSKHTTEDPAPGCLSRRRIAKMIYFRVVCLNTTPHDLWIVICHTVFPYCYFPQLVFPCWNTPQFLLVNLPERFSPDLILRSQTRPRPNLSGILHLPSQKHYSNTPPKLVLHFQTRPSAAADLLIFSPTSPLLFIILNTSL